MDPVQFLNQQYQTEASLTHSLPLLREAVTARMDRLEDRMNGALTRQSECAPQARASIQAAKAAVQTLVERIALVRDKAAQSEQAVLHITADMKLLDTSKRHLQRTITTLKRLHMLVHAVEELRLLALAAASSSKTGSSSSTDCFQTASQLVQAIRILSRHFDIYQAKVPPLQKLAWTVHVLEQELLHQVVQGFRYKALGPEQAQKVLEEYQEQEQKQQQQKQKQPSHNKKAVPPHRIQRSSSMPATSSSTNNNTLTRHEAEEPQLSVVTTTTTTMTDSWTVEQLQGGVLYLDALGVSIRQDFIRQFCRELLRPYTREFNPRESTTAAAASSEPAPPPQKRISSFKQAPPATTEPSPDSSDGTTTTTTTTDNKDSTTTADSTPKSTGLDAVEHRFLWFRQVLEDELHPVFGPIFPTNWQVQTTLARSFLRVTHDHFLYLLRSASSSSTAAPPRGAANNNNNTSTIQASVLLKALQKTLVFEKEITGWLVRECQTEFAPSNTKNKSDKPSAAPSGGDESSGQGNTNKEDGSATNAVEPLMGVASVVFDNYMAPYIALEEQSLSEQLAQALEDQTVDNRGALPVFISSTNLFVYIKGSITRCTALTKGKPFFQLYQAFSNALRKYASILDGKLPKPITALTTSSMAGITIAGLGKSAATTATSLASGASGTGTSLSSSGASSSSSSPDGSTLESFKIPPGEEVIICHVISTCEYCAETVEALEELIVDTMDDTKKILVNKKPASYRSRVNMTAEQEGFHDLTAKSIRVLVSGLIHRTQDVALKQMLATKWEQWESVGEESPYVRIIHQEVGPFCSTAKSLLPPSYFRTFCDKFAAAFGTLFYDSVIRLKRISEPGTQQLLLDLYNLKTLFLKLPVLEESSLSSTSSLSNKKRGSSIAPAMYTKLVQKQFGKIETLLKLVATPVELLIDNFKSVSGGTAAELQVVMNLKGMKRPEQVVFLEKFGLDPAKALKGATRGVSSASLVTERVQAVTSDLSQMRQKVDDFRKSFR